MKYMGAKPRNSGIYLLVEYRFSAAKDALSVQNDWGMLGPFLRRHRSRRMAEQKRQKKDKIDMLVGAITE